MILGRTRGGVSAARSSRDRGAGRFEARVEVTAGAVGFAVGTMTGDGGFLWRLGPVELGPTLGLGFAWRLPSEPGPQASTLVVPGATARVGRDGFVELRLEAPTLPADQALVVLPTVGMSLGFRGPAVTVPFPHR